MSARNNARLLRSKDAQKALKWLTGVGLIGVIAITVVLLLLLTQVTGNQSLYERNYETLFAINLLLASVLMAIISWIGWRLWTRLKKGRFGSRLLLKLALIFSLVGLLPGALIYLVSYQFVSRSIAIWFDVKVERALDAGVSLGRVSLDALSSELSAKARSATTLIGETVTLGLALERIREQTGATDVIVWNSQGQAIASTGDSRFSLSPERPTQAMLRQLRVQKSIAIIEGLDDPAGKTPPRIKAVAVLPAAGFGFNDETRYLQITFPLPSSLVTNALAVTEANREYQERALARLGLQRMYLGTLTLSLFLAVFGAILLSVLLGNQIIRPLLLLAEGVSEVAAGNLSPKSVLHTRDELGGLTRDFATMTRLLADAQETAQRSMSQVDAARTNLQTILDNLSSGVMVLNADDTLRSANPAASQILHMDIQNQLGQTVGAIQGMEIFGSSILQQFRQHDREGTTPEQSHWQHPFEIEVTPHGADPVPINLIARGAYLPSERKLVVFDDITAMVSAQRSQAWGEVARRLAHEIKNPLTPIQLSAERIEHRLQGKLQTNDEAMLSKSVKTIVDQVDAMKRLVNEFRDYARLPSADLKPIDLNMLIRDVMNLYNVGAEMVPVQTELNADCPLIHGDAQQIRQVIHNLVQNAQDATEAAHAASGEAPHDMPPVKVRTEWRTQSNRVRMTIEDHGAGFSEKILQRAFEPYVTTKIKGTGLGLAVVKKIVEEHKASIQLANLSAPATESNASQKPLGAKVSISFIVAPTQHSAISLA
jgi:nitrogen fixation/metabolism regulation signal transduction histidine kinase